MRLRSQVKREGFPGVRIPAKFRRGTEISEGFPAMV
jgi:hypothetical protein